MRTKIEPYKVKVVEPLPLTSPGDRRAALETADWNLFRVPADLVTIDLLTDSGVTAMSARQWSGLFDGDEAYAGSHSFARLEDVVQNLTGYAHVIPTHQGRAAERLLFESTVRTGDVVCGNTHFDTTRANLEAFGAIAIDLPSVTTADIAAEHPFKGDIDLVALESYLAGPQPTPMVIITITNNAAGGQPVSMANVRAARALCDRYGAILYLDAARFAENAWFNCERDPEAAGRSPRQIARAMFDLADGCTMSAKKDGLVNIGGFLALRDRKLAEEIRRQMVLGEGFPTYGGLAGRDLEAMARGLEEVTDPRYLEDRIWQVRRLGNMLHAAGVPMVRPTGGHAIYLDGRAFAPHIDPLGYPGQALACELYRLAGVRSVEVGQLMRGRRGPDGIEAPVEMDLVRLAIPRRVYTCCHLDYVAEAVIETFAHRERMLPLTIIDEPPALRHFGARLAQRDFVRSASAERTSLLES